MSAVYAKLRRAKEVRRARARGKGKGLRAEDGGLRAKRNSTGQGRLEGDVLRDEIKKRF